MMSALLYQCCRLSCAILYPTYASFKAVRGKNVREYVKWMMYWIVFALFSFVEVFSDILISWLPFYYELKLCFILWLVLPATKGSSLLYRKLVHPQLVKREKEIDGYVDKAKDQSYATLIALGSRGFTFATNVVLNTAAKGQMKLADRVQRSFSVSDLSSDAGLESRSVSSLSLAASDDGVDDTLDASQLSDRQLLAAAYSRQRRPQLRQLDLPTRDTRADEAERSVSSPYYTRSVQLARKNYDESKQAMRLRSAPSVGGGPPTRQRTAAKSPDTAGSVGSSGFDEDDFDISDMSTPGSAATTPTVVPAGANTGPSLFSRLLSGTAALASGTTTTRSATASAGSASWRSRSTYNK